MLTVVIIVAAVVVVAAAAYALTRRDTTGSALKRRFGPEYDRAIARHNGDTAATQRELGDRVKRHGALKERPLPADSLARYEAEWAGVQRRFVDSPQQAMADAATLLARLAQERGYPGPEQYDEQVAALSVHHAHEVEGYRTVRLAARGGGGTEELREALLAARSLYDVLTGGAGHVDGGRPAGPVEPGDDPQPPAAQDDIPAAARPRGAEAGIRTTEGK
ncbi:hypothetical protein [Streptomyces sp. NPDC058373]|uniref:hypothetical protein n=1 Tax=Streptomyces sp. NPDC058373 TaxID=3346465 RepID=UPI00365369FA